MGRGPSIGEKPRRWRAGALGTSCQHRSGIRESAPEMGRNNFLGIKDSKESALAPPVACENTCFIGKALSDRSAAFALLPLLLGLTPVPGRAGAGPAARGYRWARGRLSGAACGAGQQS